jgi:hypothetical protein
LEASLKEPLAKLANICANIQHKIYFLLLQKAA